MTKILGLDLGTNSIGWALVDDEKYTSTKLLDKGVVIFSEGVKKEKGNEISRAAERTGYRSVRRLKFRRKLRKYETLLVLSKNEMCPLKEQEVVAWKKSNFKDYPLNDDFLNWLRTDDDKNKHPYYFRDKASREKINKLELGRALYHLAQRRGFLSNRLDQSDKGIIELHRSNIESILDSTVNVHEFENEITLYFKSIDIADKKKKDLDAGGEKLLTLFNVIKSFIKKEKDLAKIRIALIERLNRKENLGAVTQGISELDAAIKKGGFQTLGQYFNSIYGATTQRIRKHYTAREEHYLKEFEQICKTQNLGIVNDGETEPQKRYVGLSKKLYDAIFYQRPLKSQKGLVGRCTLEPSKYRCPVSRPEYEEYRMYQYINNFKIKTPSDEQLRVLTPEEKVKIERLFYRKSKANFDFSEVVKELIPKNEEGVYFKSKSASTAKYLVNFNPRTSLSNCPTIAHFRSVFGEEWKDLNFKYVTTNSKGESVDRSVSYSDIWHVWTTFTSNSKLYDFAISKLGLNEKDATRFSKVTLKSDYASLSLKAINNILPYLKDGLIYSHAVFMANMPKVVDADKWKDESNRKLIINAIKSIIDTHQVENKIVFVINGTLKKEENNSYSKEAKEIYKNELLRAFESEFGSRKWNETNVNGLFEEKFEIFITQLELDKGKRFLSVKRIDEKVIAFLDDNDLLTNANSLYHPSDIEKFKLDKVKDENGHLITVLGSPLSGSIKNPMAMKSLHQMRRLINTLIVEGVVDERTKVHVELARELNDANKRKAIQKWQKHLEDERVNHIKVIKKLFKDNYEPTKTDLDRFKMAVEQTKNGVIVSKEDVLKFKLWDEQNHICLYTGKTISLASFLGANPSFDIEHTIPRSVSIDDSKMNKTLCDARFNREVKGSKIPFELSNHKDVLIRIAYWKRKYEKLEEDIRGLVKASKSATDKEAKDRIIQKRHYLKLECDYWRGKYSRFEKEEIKSGFKNSQIVDIGIITKYAQQYLKSYFKGVYSVKGTMVDQFKKAWGIKQTVTDENGLEKKDRSNHIHHCVDAITIACMTKPKYDVLAHAWSLEEKSKFKEAKTQLAKSKPWKNFSEDVKNVHKEVLIVHVHKDKVPVQSKKKLRKRGKIQYSKVEVLPASFKNKKEGKDYYKVVENGKTSFKIPIFQQGDTIRGSLHLDTFYGAILQQDAENNRTFEKDKEGDGIVKYVVRKSLDGLKEKDVKEIVDPIVREIIRNGIETAKIKLKTVQGAKVLTLEKDQTIWMNKQKQIPIRRVRVFTPRFQNPLVDFKKHKERFESKHPHKQGYFVKNDENYCMAIYEGEDMKGRIKRSFELLNLLDAAQFYKLSARKSENQNELVPMCNLKTNHPLKAVITKNTQVIFYKNKPEEIWELDREEIQKRLYKVIGFEADGRIQFRYHQTAMQQSSKNKDELTIVKYMKENNLKNSQINFEAPVPWLRLSGTNLNFIIDKIDFRISSIGKIVKP